MTRAVKKTRPPHRSARPVRGERLYRGARATPPTIRDVHTALLWGPNRYSENPVMRVEIAPGGGGPAEDTRRAVTFISDAASRLVAAALDWPSRAIDTAGERSVVAFEVPLHSVGRFAFLCAVELWSAALLGREVVWADAQERACTWPTDVDRRVASLLRWAGEHDLPVRPVQPPAVWSVGEGARAKLVSCEDAAGNFLSEVEGARVQGLIRRVPALVVGGEHGKTACGRMLAWALADVNASVELIGDPQTDEEATLAAGGLLDRRTMIAVVEVPRAELARRDFQPYGAHRARLTIILGTLGPGERKLQRAAQQERYLHYLNLARRTLPGGWVVLNADDAMCRRLARALRGTHVDVVLVSATRGLQRRRTTRTPTYTLSGGQVVGGVGPRRRAALSTAPLGSVGGLPVSYRASLIAAVAALDVLEVKPLTEIVEILARFRTVAAAPGCFNLFVIRGARVLVHRTHDVVDHRLLCTELRGMIGRLGINRVDVLCATADTEPVVEVYRRAGARVAIVGRGGTGLAAVSNVARFDTLLSGLRSMLSGVAPDGLLVVAARDVRDVLAECQRLVTCAPLFDEHVVEAP